MVQFSPVLEKSSSLQLSTPECTNNVDLAAGKKETSIQLSASNIIQFDSNDVKISGLTASPLSTADLIEEKESDLVSVSYPLNMKDISLGKISRGDSGDISCYGYYLFCSTALMLFRKVVIWMTQLMFLCFLAFAFFK